MVGLSVDEPLIPSLLVSINSGVIEGLVNNKGTPAVLSDTVQSVQSVHSLSQFIRSVVSDSWQPHEPQYARPPCPSPTPGVYSNSCPSSR